MKERKIKFGDAKANVLIGKLTGIASIISVDIGNTKNFLGCLSKIELLAKRLNLTEIWVPIALSEPLTELLEKKGYKYTSLGRHPMSKQVLQGYKKILK